MSTIVRRIAVVGALLASVQVAQAAPPADHLQCFRIKDAATRAVYKADLTPTDPTFPLAPGCTVIVPARLLCVDVVKSNVTPPPPGSPVADPARPYLCYKTKCPKARPVAGVEDQFGTRNVQVKTTGLLCAPLNVVTTTTTTTTLPAASCTDGIMNGNETDIDCGGACPSCAVGEQCSTASDCTSGVCSGGVCVALLANGGACSSGPQCASGVCVDGVCCDSSCSGICEACAAATKGWGSDGACGSIILGSDPDAECADSPASSCGTDGTCSGSGSCALYAGGTPCAGASCTGGVQTLARDCDGAGTCAPGATQACSPYVCGPTACKTSCAANSDCASGFQCAGGMCRLANGGACSSASQCASGVCVDGVCCDSSCSGICEACTAATKGGGSDGHCGSIIAGRDPEEECAGSPASSCGTNGTCSGSGSCALYASGTPCAGASCTGGVQTLARDCDGAGTCAPGATQACSPYVCGPTACKTLCADNSDCAAGFNCSAGMCQSL